MKPPMDRDALAKLVEEALESGGYLMFRFGHGQIRQLRPEETEVVLGALKATPPEVERIVSEDPLFYYIHNREDSMIVQRKFPLRATDNPMSGSEETIIFLCQKLLGPQNGEGKS